MTVYSLLGALLPAATMWIPGMVKISKNGGAFANTVSLPVSISGGGDGDFDLVLSVAETDTIGNIRIRVYDDASGTNLLAEYVNQVTAQTTAVTTGGNGGSSNWAFFGCGILKTDILAIAPQLSTLPDSAWFTILAFINTFKGFKCDPALKRMALIFLAAHLGSMASSTGSSGATGPVVSESAGGLKRTYGVSSSSTTSDLGQTPYGIQYLAIIGMSPELALPVLLRCDYPYPYGRGGRY